MARFTTNMSARDRRHRRVRARVVGTAARPRLSVFRSAKRVTAQLIDDAAGRTIAAASDRDIATADSGRQAADGAQRRVAFAREVGKTIAARGKERGVTRVVFDRGGYAYHGIVRAVADGAREGGLEF